MNKYFEPSKPFTPKFEVITEKNIKNNETKQQWSRRYLGEMENKLSETDRVTMDKEKPNFVNQIKVGNMWIPDWKSERHLVELAGWNE